MTNGWLGGQQAPHMQLAHGPLVSHAAAAIMQSPALATPAGSPASAHAAQQHHHPAAVPNQPCSTLFIANLGHNVAEHELKDIFSRYARKVRMLIFVPKSHSVFYVLHFLVIYIYIYTYLCMPVCLYVHNMDVQ